MNTVKLLLKRIVGYLALWADVALDQIPSYEGGRWYRYGDWGCRFGLGRNVWSPLLDD